MKAKYLYNEDGAPDGPYHQNLYEAVFRLADVYSTQEAIEELKALLALLRKQHCHEVRKFCVR